MRCIANILLSVALAQASPLAPNARPDIHPPADRFFFDPRRLTDPQPPVPYVEQACKVCLFRYADIFVRPPPFGAKHLQPAVHSLLFLPQNLRPNWLGQRPKKLPTMRQMVDKCSARFIEVKVFLPNGPMCNEIPISTQELAFTWLTSNLPMPIEYKTKKELLGNIPDPPWLPHRVTTSLEASTAARQALKAKAAALKAGNPEPPPELAEPPPEQAALLPAQDPAGSLAPAEGTNDIGTLLESAGEMANSVEATASTPGFFKFLAELLKVGEGIPPIP
ncbi:MAG: hypothetical protein M1829_001185 [Trizodia sp. TS-e1964]|nr:MAG: hypothetical protein M1829_001185 [Trizodia sp. TS-e1964]